MLRQTSGLAILRPIQFNNKKVYLMGFINRHALLIAPKEPFYEWVKKVNPQAASEIPEDPLAEDGATIYLIPEFESQEDALEWMEENFETFFESELYSWVDDDEQWPLLSWEQFSKWFYVSYQSMVENTVEGPLLEEDEDFFDEE